MATNRRINWTQLGLIKRADEVDVRIMLLIVDAVQKLGDAYSEEQMAELFALPVQGAVSYVERLREGKAVAAFWEGGLLQAALEFKAPWHSLVEAANDKKLLEDPAAKQEFFTKVEAFLLRNHEWPLVGTLRQWRGRPSNHRPKGDQPGQDSFPV